uniref:Major facilitator superfamily associated domain-containing protein n=1 Tax=Timema cristinae TaxID=61476 RepID=A0A7R9CXQ7_TIMCR|nr:unnamed protein product [Timema cristinae]
MTILKAFFHRIIKDFKQKELLPLKLLFFVHASTLYVLYPYLTLHLRELGINVEETAIMSAVTPIVAIVMPPLAGMVADRIGNFKILLSIFSSLGGGAALLLLLVPVGRITFTYPEKLIMDLSCHENSYLQLSLPDTLPCSHLNSFNEANTSILTNITLESCGFVCHQSRTSIDFKNESNRILQAHSYNIIISSFNNDTDSYFYTLKREEGYQGSFDITEDARNHKQVQNNEHYTSSIRKLSNYTFYFPSLDMYNLSCDGQSNECHLGSYNSLQGEFKDSQTMKKTFKANLKLNSENTVMNDNTVFKISLDQRNQYDQSKISKKKLSDSTCQDMYLNEKKTIMVSVQLHNLNNALEVDNVIQLSSCQPHCIATLIRKNICTDMKKDVEYDVNLTFWVYLLVRVFIGMIGGTAFAMFEGAVIAILREQNGDYGMQRIYATMGGMISSPLSGLLIDYASRGIGYTDFRQERSLRSKVDSGNVLTNNPNENDGVFRALLRFRAGGGDKAFKNI